MAGRRWIRLDLLWEESEWLEELDGTAAGCWPRLLCMVKRDGVAGRCPRPSTRKLAKKWRVPAESVLAMEAAAIVDEALSIVDGEWVVHNWKQYQDYDPTNAERQKRFRKNQREAAGQPLKIVGGK